MKYMTPSDACNRPKNNISGSDGPHIIAKRTWNTAIPIMAAYTMKAVVMLFEFPVAFIDFVSSSAIRTASRSGTLHIHEVEQGHDKHPDDIDEVPVEGPDFDVLGGVTSGFVSQPDDGESDDATDNVQHVQSGDGKEGGAKHGRSPGILEHADAFSDERTPLAEVKDGEECTPGGGDHGPLEGCGAVVVLSGADRKKNGQAAGNQNEGHQQGIPDAGVLERRGPVDAGVADVAVGEQEGGECHRVRDDEQPHHQLAGWNRKG